MLDEKTQELIAIGASITANCQPCLDYHAAAASRHGADGAEILAAIETGKQVRRGAALKMDRHAAALDGGTVPADDAADCRMGATEPPADPGRLLDGINGPALLMQGNPRQVVSANPDALALFGKDMRQVEGRRGGQVFDCAHSFSATGCGADVNCEHCAIKDAIVATFATGLPHGASATLPVRKAGVAGYRTIQVSAEKRGDLAVVRIERHDDTGGPPPAST